MAAKKTTKKAAKKNYTSAKKTTVPKLRLATLEELAVFMAENHAKTEASIQKLSTENRKLSIENRKLSAENRETWKVLQETLRTVDKTSATVDKTSAEVNKTSAYVREMSKKLSHLGADVGELMEFVVIPKIRLAMNATGKHSFDSMQTDKTFRKIDELGEKKPLTEVDVLLLGKTEVMAVETKSYLTMREVSKHLERLDILRKNEELVDIKDKPLFGAVVGAVVEENAKKFALDSGLYVVTIREEEDKLNIENPETCRTW